MNANLNDAEIVTLAEINNQMMAIRASLGSNPAVNVASRGCDIRRYRDLVLDEDVCCFEAYVEAQTRTNSVFSWSLDLTLTSSGWRFHRRIARQTTDGEQVERAFEDFTFNSFDDFVSKSLGLMAEFVETAKDYDFGP